MSRRRIALASAVMVAATVLAATASSPARGSSGISQRRGWDACGVGSSANAGAFWSNTPYWNMGLYLGGSSYGTGCTQWTKTGVANLRSEGWKFLPIWVGPQAPCTDYASRFSSDPSTAYSQGFNEATKAYNRLVDLGLDVNGTPVIYDLEGFQTTNSACVKAAQQFISGWVADLHLAPAQKAGVYGSACASTLNSFRSITSPPDFIDAAQWDGNPNTATLGCVASSAWNNRQRHKQYVGGHSETWNGVTLTVDNDCSNGPVYPSPDALDTGQGCVASAALAETPVDAARVTADFGWVLTTRHLLLTHDGGRTFTPAPVGGSAAAFLDDRVGMTVTVSGTALVASRTDDGGVTWRSTVLHDPSAGPAGYSDVAVEFGTARFGAILARTATSPAFSVGTLFATHDGGASWSAHRAPEAGQLAVEPTGRIWVAGHQLNASADQGATWTRARVDVPDGTFSAPVHGVLPVTRSSEVDLLTSADGGLTWGRATPVPVRARTGGGTRIPVAATAAGPTVFDSVAGHAYRLNAGRNVAPTGLPDGVDAVTFAADGSAGWALAHYGTCTGGKQGCVLHHELLASADSGTTWRRLAAWNEDLGG